MIELKYDEISPITNNLCVIVDTTESGQKSYMCMESGFVTNESLLIDSDNIITHESYISQLMRDAKCVDYSRGLVWYPTYIHVGNYVLYCTGDQENLTWEVATIVALSDEEIGNYPIPGRNAEFYDARIDTDTAIQYANFGNAMEALYGNIAKLYKNSLETEE